MTIDLTITGGNFAGQYQESFEGGCAAASLFGLPTFAVSTVRHPGAGFNGFEVTVHDASAAATGTDSEFSARFSFNDDNNAVEVNPFYTTQEGYGDVGTGTLVLEDKGSTATITIDGIAAGGSAVSAAIGCAEVGRL